MTDSTDKIDELLPLKKLFPLGLQHVLAMYAGAVVVPIIISNGLHLSKAQMAYLISADLFTCGIATLLQAVGIKNWVGIKLPAVLGCSFASVGPLISIGSTGGMGAIYGSIIFSGILVFFLSSFFGKLLKFFPPVVTGSVVTLIGLSLIPIAISNVAGGMGAPDFGAARNLLLGALVLGLILAFNKLFKGFWQAISVLLAIIIGTSLATCIGMVSFEEVKSSPFLNIVTPFYFGFPKFTPSGVLTMTLVAMVCMIESIGVFFGLGRICDKHVTEKDVVKGLRAEGLAQILGGIFNSFPYTTFSQNVGLVALTRVRSRFVVVASGFILIALGILPKFAALATVIPNPVLGGAMIAMFGMVTISGIKILSTVDLANTNNMLIAGCSLSIGLGKTIVPNLFEHLPMLVKVIFDSAIVTGSITALFLNIILNWKQIKTTKTYEIPPVDEHAL